MSLYFNGTSDYLSIPDSDDWYFGTEDFTTDFWVNFDSASSTQILWEQAVASFDDYTQVFINSARIYFYAQESPSIIANYSALWTPITGTWYHIAIVRNGTSILIFIDGQSQSLTITQAIGTSSLPNVAGPLTIGGRSVSGVSMDGYLDEFRISKGIARWTTDFTPPTIQHTSDSYTKLLLHMDGDKSESGHTISCEGVPQLNTAITKWNGSMYFDGSSDYLTIPDDDGFDFGSDDFTIDFWVKQTTGFSGNAYYLDHSFDSDNRVYFYNGDGSNNGLLYRVMVSGSTIVDIDDFDAKISDANWHHMAVVRNGTSWIIYKDGINVASDTADIIYPDIDGDITLGRYNTEYLNGYIDELRVSKGIARWTSDFIPPTAPYYNSLVTFASQSDMTFSLTSSISENFEPTFTLIDNDDQGAGYYTDVWGDGTFLYAACNDDGLRSYSVDGAGNLTYIDTDDQGSFYKSVWGDGTYIYAACQSHGLRSYSVDGSGNLTYLDVDDQGGDDYGWVWGDGTYIYVACNTSGLRSYTAGVGGDLTHMDVIDQGGDYLGVWGDGNFIYAACSAGGLRSYSVGVGGILTYIDTDDQGDNYYGVWGDGNFIYATCVTGGLRSYSVDGAGNLTYIDTDDQGQNYYGVWGDGNFIYTTTTGGIRSYSVDGSGNLTYISEEDTFSCRGVWGDGTYIYAACYESGLSSYTFD